MKGGGGGRRGGSAAERSINPTVSYKKKKGIAALPAPHNGEKRSEKQGRGSNTRAREKVLFELGKQGTSLQMLKGGEMARKGSGKRGAHKAKKGQEEVISARGRRGLCTM